MRGSLVIYIPTLGRPTDQRTWNAIPNEWRARTIVVVREREYDAHLAAGIPSENLFVLPAKVPEGLSPTRQYLVEEGADVQVQLDDDLRFYRRLGNTNVLMHAEETHVGEMLEAIEVALDTYALVGVSDRRFNFTNPHNIKVNDRAVRVLAYRADVIRPWIRFHPVGQPDFFMQDVYSALQVLDHGYESCVLYRWAQAHNENPKEGGCDAMGRNFDKIERCARLIAGQFPHCVELAPKEETHSNRRAKYGEGLRYDLKISWKKAFRGV